jgi:CBS domain-containing protein
MIQMRVRDVMTTEPVTVGIDRPLKDVATLLFERGIAGVPVVDEQGRPVGMVSETDLLAFEDLQAHEPQHRSLVELFLHPERAARFGALAHGVRAGDVMTTPVHSIGPDVPVTRAIGEILRHRLHRLPVLGPQGDLVGIVSLHDLLAPLVRSDEDLAREIHDDIVSWVLADQAPHVRVTADDGVIHLDGHVESRSQAAMLVQMSLRVPGVTGVEDHLTCEDEGPRPEPHVEPAIATVERTVRLR